MSPENYPDDSLPPSPPRGRGTRVTAAIRWFVVGATASAATSLLLGTSRRWRSREQTTQVTPDDRLAQQPFEQSPPEQHPPKQSEGAVYLESSEVRYPDGRIEHPAIRREPRDVSPRLIFTVLIVAAIVGGSATIGLWGFLMFLRRPSVPPSSYDPPPLTSRLPPSPRLDPLINVRPEVLESTSYGIEDARRLHRYGRTDEPGFVHIPIEKAIELTAGRLPVRESQTAGNEKSNGLLAGGEPNSGRLYRPPPSWIKKQSQASTRSASP